jgi:WD40 repeat protein
VETGFCPACALREVLTPREAGAPTESEPVRPVVQRVGDYELLEEIARGGMGVVYRARQSSLNRAVALKMMLAGPLATPALLQRFRTEAEAAAALDHPNIVPIYEVGEEEGRHFFTMKLIEGGSLAQRIAGGRVGKWESGKNSSATEVPPAHFPAFSPTRQAASGQGSWHDLRGAASLLAKVARAVHYAHQRGVLHRDLKPTNILIDTHGEPHVTDFGLAKLIEHDSTLTQTAAILGTPAYMAPEQAAGGGKQTTTAADIYSLGAVLYETLTGEPPFRAETPLATLKRVVEQEPRRPRALNPRVDEDLETICLKCLNKDPGARYPSALALAEDLEHWLAGEPVAARPATMAERWARWCRRNPVVASLIAAVALLLAGLFAQQFVSTTRIAREANRARRAEASATEKLRRSYLDQARAERRSGREGQRFRSLAAVAQAASLRFAPALSNRAAAVLELRNEAIAALALPDVRFTHAFRLPPSGVVSFDMEVSRYVLTRSDGSFSVRRFSDHQELAVVPAIGSTPERLLGFSPDGQFTAARYYDGFIRVWDIGKSKEVVKESNAIAGAFSPVTNTFLLCRRDHTASVFSLEPVHEIRRWPMEANLRLIRFEPKGSRFAGFSERSRILRVFDADSGSQVLSLTNTAELGDFAWSADGELLATGCDNGAVFLWNAQTGEQKARLEGHEDHVSRLGFNHAGNLLVTYSRDGAFVLWDLVNPRPLLTAEIPTWQTLFTPDDQHMAYTVRGAEAGLLEIIAHREFRRLHGRISAQRGSWSLDLSPDGRLLAASNPEGVRVWDFRRGCELISLPIGDCRSVRFTADGQNLLTSGAHGLERWPIRITRRERVDEVHLGRAQSIHPGQAFMYASLSGNERKMAAVVRGGDAAEIQELNSNGERVRVGPQRKMMAVALSADGRLLATGAWGASGVKVWDVARRQLVRDLPSRGSTTVTFSPDNHLLVTASESYRVWEVDSWRERYRVTEADKHVTPGEAAFSPDGRMLALVIRGHDIRLVKAETGEVLADFNAPQARLLSGLRFSRDGSQLAALEWDQQIQVWDLRRIRQELAQLDLDWDEPPFPAETENRSDAVPLVPGSRAD